MDEGADLKVVVEVVRCDRNAILPAENIDSTRITEGEGQSRCVRRAHLRLYLDLVQGEDPADRYVHLAPRRNEADHDVEQKVKGSKKLLRKELLENDVATPKEDL
ncbi:hypothetical protein RB195_000775 [Necator americanus]|uniref:Uncharacterized protein n=1 Tax=Necator americanus TaxID=51031 RepID=A0ABR1DBB0_NECAM